MIGKLDRIVHSYLLIRISNHTMKFRRVKITENRATKKTTVANVNIFARDGGGFVFRQHFVLQINFVAAISLWKARFGALASLWLVRLMPVHLWLANHYPLTRAALARTITAIESLRRLVLVHLAWTFFFAIVLLP